MKVSGKPPRSALAAVLASAWGLWLGMGIACGEPPIFSLHGRTKTDHNVDPGSHRAGDAVTYGELWAKGDAVRQEIEFGDDTLIQIQRGERIYSFSVEDQFGMVVRGRGGLGTMGLVRQIEEIKANGTVVPSQGAFFDTSRLIDEADSDVYRYEDRLTGEVVHVALERDDSIPRIWVGLLPNGNVTVTHYRDMEANVEISDTLFDVPEEIDLSATSICEFAQQQENEQLLQTCNAALLGDMAAQGDLGFLCFRAAERAQAGARTQEYRAAAWWYRKAAMAGHTSSQHNIGFLYAQGLGVRQDHEKAAYWFHLAAEKAYPPSEYNLGKAYMEGLGVTEDHAVANRWLQAAAQHGYAAAQFELGLNYLGGIGVASNTEEAYAWLATAASQGFDLGTIDLPAILADMTIDQRRRAEGLAASHVEKYSPAHR